MPLTVSELIGKRVEFLVSDPWELGTECGVGPFAAVVISALSEGLLLQLGARIEFKPRTAPFGGGDACLLREESIR